VAAPAPAQPQRALLAVQGGRLTWVQVVGVWLDVAVSVSSTRHRRAPLMGPSSVFFPSVFFRPYDPTPDLRLNRQYPLRVGRCALARMRSAEWTGSADPQPQPPIMTSFWATTKVQFRHRHRWPTKAAAVGDGARAKCSKRPASLWAQDEAVPLGSVVAVVVAESVDHHALVRDRRGNGPVRSADRDLVVSIDRARQAAAVGCGNRSTRPVPDAGRPRWIQGGCSTCWVIRSSNVARSTTSCAQWLPAT
jgi:hypothetical protein